MRKISFRIPKLFVRGLGLGAILALSVSNAPALHAQSACDDVSGVWVVDLDLPGSGQNSVTITLEQTECEVAGVIEGRNTTHIEDGKVEGPTAIFTAVAHNQANGQALPIVWNVTVEGDDVSGTLNSPMMGIIEFTGTRAGS